MALVLIVGADGPLLDQVVGQLEAGYTIQRATSTQAALELVRRTSPDAIIVAAELPDEEPAELCRLLRRAPRVMPHTAIFIAGDLASRDARLAALRAGASDIFGQPLDVAELLLKLDTYAQLKSLAEEIQSASLVDRETGLYNLQGLARRVEELRALSVRAHGALACVVLAPEVEDDDLLREVTAFCAQTIKDGVRHSDVPGRIAAAEFAVLAPRTGATGAIRLAQRLMGVMRRRSQDAAGAVPSFQLRAGYDAVGNLAYAPGNAGDMLVRARRARHDADAGSRLGWIRPFEGSP
jgi:PleD family two-component response regulator